MLDLSKLDLEEIAAALADQTDYEHRWLINPRRAEGSVLACLSLLVLQRGAWVWADDSQGRIVQVDALASARANRAPGINDDVSRLSEARPACAEAGELDSCWAE